MVLADKLRENFEMITGLKPSMRHTLVTYILTIAHDKAHSKFTIN